MVEHSELKQTGGESSATHSQLKRQNLSHIRGGGAGFFAGSRGVIAAPVNTKGG